MCVGVGLQAAAWSIPMFIGARYTSAYHVFPNRHLLILPLVGFGLSFCQNAAPLLLIELAYPTHVFTIS